MPDEDSGRSGALGPDVSAIGLGCMGMSFAYGERDDDGSTQTLDRALDLGVNHLDTADMYGCGAQRGAGRLGRPAGGGTRSSSRRSSPTAADADGNGAFVDSSGAWAREACDASLAPAGDRHDRPVLHAPRATRRPRSRRRWARWRSWWPPARSGTSACPRSARRPCGRRTPYTRSRPCRWSTRCSAGTPSRARCSTTCRELGVAVVAYSPVGRGLLTGTFTSRSDLADGDFRRVGAAVQRREHGRQPEAGGGRSRRSPPRSAARRRRRRWPGCSPRATTSSRSPAPSGCRTWRRTRPRPTSR